MKHSNRVRDLATVAAAVALTWGTLAASAGTYFIPYFPGAQQNCANDNCPNNGEIRLVNRSASSTTVTLSGRDQAGVSGGDDFTTDSIPGYGSIRVTDTQLEGGDRWRNGTGPWSITVTVPDGADVVIVPFRYNRGGGAIEVVPLPVQKLEAPAPEPAGLHVSEFHLYEFDPRRDLGWIVNVRVRYPQSDGWTGCQAILLRPNPTTGAYLPVVARSWTHRDLPTGYQRGDAYIDPLVRSRRYYLGDGEQVEALYTTTIYPPIGDSTLYQVRSRCWKTTGEGESAVTTWSAVVNRCLPVHSTATCPSA